MTHPTMEQPERPVARHTNDHTRQRRWSILYAAALIAIGAVAMAWIGEAVNRERQQEINRADNTLVAYRQACDQLERLGLQCPKPPSDSPRGAPGPRGEPGRAPTQAEIAAAVAAYLAEHPPAAGPPGPPGEPATGCPLLGYHFEVLTVRLVGADTKSRQILACVPD